VQDQVAALKAVIDEKIGDKIDPEDMDDKLETFAELNLDLFEDDDEPTTEPIEPKLAMPEADKFSSLEVFDQYLSAEILMDHGGKYQLGTVKWRAKDNDGNPPGISDRNPILDTWQYKVEFPDGTVDVLTANAIATSLYAQVDSEGRRHLQLMEIIDHQKDNTAVSIDDSRILGTIGSCRMTRGWDLLVVWKDGSND